MEVGWGERKTITPQKPCYKLKIRFILHLLSMTYTLTRLKPRGVGVACVKKTIKLQKSYYKFKCALFCICFQRHTHFAFAFKDILTSLPEGQRRGGGVCERKTMKLQKSEEKSWGEKRFELSFQPNRHRSTCHKPR